MNKLTQLDDLIKKLEGEGVPETDYSEMHRRVVTDLEVEPPRPPLAISIGVSDYEYNGTYYPLRYGTFGNISLIKGHEKVRKSFAKSLLIACAIGGKANNYCDLIRGHDLSDKWIIDVDSEQSEHDVWQNANRIPKMVGALPDNYLSVQLRAYSQTERVGYMDWLINESDMKDNIGLICMDGYVDFVKDFNSQSDSTEFTQKLMTWSSKANCHITGILHLNPNMTKARGHLGTILQQKCETVVQIEDQGSYSTFKCERARGQNFKDFNFTVDPATWLPYMMEGVPEGENEF